MDKLNCAVVGCGNIAQGYDSPEDSRIRTHVKAYLENANCNLVGVCDQDKNKLQDLQSRWGLIPIFNKVETKLLLKILTPCKTIINLKIYKRQRRSRKLRN